MIFLKIAAILFLVLSIALSIIIVSFLGLQKKGWNFADIAFPLLAIAFYLISDKAYYHSLLPQLAFGLSLLAMGITAHFLLQRRDFTYKRFFKFFWRAGFLLTFLIYLALVISLFFMK